ncbi:hypothetical protein [Dehalobacter sp. DCM]
MIDQRIVWYGSINL